MDALDQNIVHVAIPLGVFTLSIIITFSLMRVLSPKVAKWASEQDWPAETIVYESIRQPVFLFCLLLSSLLAMVASALTPDQKRIAEDVIWTLFVADLVFAILNMLRGSIQHIGKRLSLPGASSAIRRIITQGVLVVAVLVALGIWGVPTAPILLALLVIALLILVALRDATPDYFAAFQITIWEHIRVGEAVRLQNGQQGVVTKLGWHNVELLTPEGETLYVPNAQMARQIITTFTQSPQAVKVAIDFFEKQTASELCPEEETKPCDNLASTLSRRELEIADLVSEGATNKELAQKLFITENTVKVHIKNILVKLELKNRQQLAVLAATRPKKGQ